MRFHRFVILFRKLTHFGGRNDCTAYSKTFNVFWSAVCFVRLSFEIWLVVLMFVPFCFGAWSTLVGALLAPLTRNIWRYLVVHMACNLCVKKLTVGFHWFVILFRSLTHFGGRNDCTAYSKTFNTCWSAVCFVRLSFEIWLVVLVFVPLCFGTWYILMGVLFAQLARYI